jgi:hypothetical protein
LQFLSSDIFVRTERSTLNSITLTSICKSLNSRFIQDVLASEKKKEKTEKDKVVRGRRVATRDIKDLKLVA